MSGCVIRCERPKNKCGAENKFWRPKCFGGGGRKSYLAAKHHSEAAPKQNKTKKRGFSAWAPKNTTLGRLRSKGLLSPSAGPAAFFGFHSI